MIPDHYSLPLMVMADSEGRVFEHPELLMMGAEGRNHRPPEKDEIIQVHHGADLFVLPGRHPVGLDPQSGQKRVVRSFEGQPVFAVSAFLPPAFTSLLWAAFARDPDTPVLPLYTYSSLGWKGESFVTTAIRIDPDPRQDLDHFPADGTEDRNARLAVQNHPENRPHATCFWGDTKRLFPPHRAATQSVSDASHSRRTIVYQPLRRGSILSRHRRRSHRWQCHTWKMSQDL
jgi:hypothetical protein